MNILTPRRVLQCFEARLFFVTWLVYALHIAPGGGVSPNRALDLTHSLVNEHSVTIDTYHENTIDKAFKDGHYYQLGMPGPALAGIPAYLSFKPIYALIPDVWLQPFQSSEFLLSTVWITCFTLSLLAAFAAVVLFRLLFELGLSRSHSLIATIAYAFGTPVFCYATNYFSHGFAASLTIFILYLLHRVKSERADILVVLGLATGLAVLMEYQAFFLAIAVTAFLLVKARFRKLWPYFAGAAIPLSLLLLYNTIAFGGPLYSSYQFIVGPHEMFHRAGVLGFTVPRLDRFFGLTLSRRRGIFVFSPVMILSVLGFVSLLRQRKQPAYGIALLSAAVTIVVWLWVSSFEGWHGGASFGPRYIVCTLPFVAIGLGFSLRFVPRMIFLPLLIVSLVTNWLGAQFSIAQSIGDPWRRAWSSGIALPATDAILRYSRGDNLLTAFITQRSWIIITFYLVLICACVLLILRSMFPGREALSRV